MSCLIFVPRDLAEVFILLFEIHIELDVHDFNVNQLVEPVLVELHRVDLLGHVDFVAH